VEQSPVSIGITDAAGVIQYVNPSFALACGYGHEQLRGQTMRILNSGATTPEQYRELWDTITSGRVWRGQFCNRKSTGDLFWERESIFPMRDDGGKITHFVTVKEDITELRELEDHLRRSQRMEAVGTLASGIAHDLNNILSPMLLLPELLKETVQGEKEVELLDLIAQGAQRASDVVKQLLTFIRGSGGERVPLHLRHLLNEFQALLAETFPREIVLHFDVSPNLLPVLGETTQLHQVLLNLCMNSRDAMPGGGTITLHAANTVVDAELARVSPLAKPGPHVLISVTDTGHGMTPNVMERVFDPFFTTKGIGAGTGLGLSTALGIVRSHGGFMTVSSKPDEGATFRIYLPGAHSDSLAPSRVATTGLPEGNSELILIVDDEPSIRGATRLALETHGYRALVASGGADGLVLFRQHASEISLVLTDVMMPGMSGVAMLREMLVIEPRLKALVMTGMTSNSNRAEIATLGVGEPLAKPFRPRDLIAAVQGVLSRAGRS
jgi:PAS domain S-box-containing protein